MSCHRRFAAPWDVHSLGKPLKVLTSIGLALCLATQSAAQTCSRDAMLVFDGSASMAELGFGASGPSRIEEARAAVAEVMPQVAPVRRIGLLTYGPGAADSCRGIQVKFAPAENADRAVIAEVEALSPAGLTPLTDAVREAAEVLNYRTSAGIIVLVTDGSETCRGQPCRLGRDLAASGRDLTVHIIGFRLVFDPFSWNSVEAFQAAAADVQCLADQTGGSYVTTETVDELADALRRTLGCALVG